MITIHGMIDSGVVIDRSSDENAGDSSSTDDDDNPVELHEQSSVDIPTVALACDDGCVRLYTVSDTNEFIFKKSLPGVSGRALSVTWSPDGNMLYSGSSDGFIRCWDVKRARELCRVTVGLGGLGSGPDLCVWSLVALRSGTLVRLCLVLGQSLSQHGTLLQAHSHHKGDVSALATDPSHRRIFSAGPDGKVTLYKLSSNASSLSSGSGPASDLHNVTPHTHDVRALTVATPIVEEATSLDKKLKKIRRQEKPRDYSYHKWAHLGVPMLLSSGDDAKLYAYSVKEFLNFAPHDICPAPQRVPLQLVPISVVGWASLLLVQSPDRINIPSFWIKNGLQGVKGSLVAQVNSKSRVICSAISPSGSLVSYSDHTKTSLFEFKKSGIARRPWSLKLPSARSMTFTSDSSRLIIAGHDTRIYVIDTVKSDLLHVLTPRCKEQDEDLPPDEPPIVKTFVSADGQWLASINCFGDIYIFNLEIFRAPCLIDFALPVDRAEPNTLISNGRTSEKLKRKLQEHKRNFEFFSFSNPVLFFCHLSQTSAIVVHKSWKEVLAGLEAPSCSQTHLRNLKRRFEPWKALSPSQRFPRNPQGRESVTVLIKSTSS